MSRLNTKEAIDKITKIAQSETYISAVREKTLNVLSAIDDENKEMLLEDIVQKYKKAKDYNTKRNFQIISPLIASTTKNWGGEEDESGDDLKRLEKLDGSTKEKIELQENYINKQAETRKKTLEDFNKQHPMGKDVEISFGIPVKEYKDIDNTLASITTNQTLDPKKYEVVILLNRPNKKAKFDKATEEKILKFKLAHPEYNIHLFKHTFDFPENEKANMGKIYKLLGDTIVHRNIQRKNISGMDMKKIRNLIVKRGATDSTEKHPDYLKHQLEMYSRDYGGKELVRLTGDSRIPKDLALAYPLIEIDEFFQRYYDLEYAHGDPLKRDVGLGSYKARCYCGAGGTPPIKVKEDTTFVQNVRNYVERNKRSICMYHDKDFIGATDGSTDRGIYSITEGTPYCRRYQTGRFDKKDRTKKVEWNSWAVENKGKPETQCLELTTKNLERDLSALYMQRVNGIFRAKKNQNYRRYLNSPAGKKSTDAEKKVRIAKNIVNSIFEKILQKADFMGLDESDYSMEITKSGTTIVHFNPTAIGKILTVQKQKIKSGYYDYFK